VDRSILSTRSRLRDQPPARSRFSRRRGFTGPALTCTSPRDEVYGSLEPPLEPPRIPLNPSSPYSAPKWLDLLARSYFLTYGLPVIVTRASNTRAVPISGKADSAHDSNVLEGQPLLCTGTASRSGAGSTWMTTAAVFAPCSTRPEGQIYNIGGNCRSQSRSGEEDSARRGRPESLIAYVTDRPGHDRRYALSSERSSGKTGWRAKSPSKRVLPTPWSGTARMRVGCARARPESIRLLRRNYTRRDTELRDARGR